MCWNLTPRQILREHPDLEIEDIQACLRFASSRVSHPVVAGATPSVRLAIGGKADVADECLVENGVNGRLM